MCGIAGEARSDGGPIDRDVLEAMCSAQEHRGPDARGLHLDEGIGLGIQRLAVIDLDTGDQPIYNEDGTVAVVLNGEIYNYRELRRDLERRGHRFATKGDTEVIPHLYEELGPGCVRELHGMFAFALWDSAARRLMVSRDRVGKKPLFYCERDGRLSFASELRALLADRRIPRDLDLHALDCYFAYQYVPSPLSAFRAVRRLPPGSTLLYQGGRLSIDRYWRLRYESRQPVPQGPELHEELRRMIRRAVSERMISDVPLGAFLSGGIDSATVVAAMAESSPEPVRTFSIGFEEEDWNELPNARLIAERFSTAHEELVVKPDLVAIIPKVARHYGEPFGDPSSVPSFYVAEMARRGVTVALNGDGGDENFAGYHRYVTASRTHRIASLLPTPARRAIGAVGGRTEMRGDPARTANRARRLARSLALSDRDSYSRAMELFKPEERRRLYAGGFADRLRDEPKPQLLEAVWDGATADELVNRMLEVDVNTYLPDDLLVKVDIASMAYSLEARSPLLDHRLMELTAPLPGSLKIRGTDRKVVMREALRGWIPDRILDGPKRGFGLPMVGRWFRHELRGYITDVLTDPAAIDRGYFDPSYVRELLDRHQDGSRDNSTQLWALLMFEIWHREIVD
jgi:asparagine synthase (glutamine-hydrolysing)